MAHDAQDRGLIARYGMIERGGHTEAVIEMSAASGLALVTDRPLDPLRASTRGTGDLMLDALQHGAQRILLGIGGSATHDGGCGMAVAMGHRFLDANGNEVTELPAALERVARIEPAPSRACVVTVASDVTNPLLGEHGATRVYGGQKGVTDFAFFEARLQRLADMVKRDLGCDYREVPGAGAAGGLGFGLMSFCGAKLQSGFDLVAEVTGLRKRIEHADLIITGEGRLDAQTLHGKGPAGVAEMARALGKPVVGIGGTVESREALLKNFDAIWEVRPPEMPLATAMAHAADLLENCAARNAGTLERMAR
jgi:glycerate kinase